MARLFCSVNILVTIILLIGIASATKYRRQTNETKETLCTEYNTRFSRDFAILQQILTLYNNEINELRDDRAQIENEIKFLNATAKRLRHRIDFPEQPDIEIRISGKGGGLTFIRFEAFEDTGNNDSCFVFKKNLETLVSMDNAINGFEASKTEYNSQIASLTEERNNLDTIVKDLENQLKARNNVTV